MRNTEKNQIRPIMIKLTVIKRWVECPIVVQSPILCQIAITAISL